MRVKEHKEGATPSAMSAILRCADEYLSEIADPFVIDVSFDSDDGVFRRYHVGNNPVNFVDPLGLLAEVIILQPVGWGGSSFGHVAININGTTYSFGPDGMSVMSTSDYLKRNSFCEGVGTELNLTSDQEARLQACLAGDQGEYGEFTNNCGTPVQKCLKKIGIDVGWNLFPVSLGYSLMNSGSASKYNFYPATTPATGTSAPWTK